MSLDPVFVGDPLPQALNEERVAINNLQDGLATKISLPAGAATGDLLRWDGTQWLTTDTRFFEGNGPPNGVVAAPVGSRYVDKLATDGLVEWLKNSGGEGNGGWFSGRGVTGGAFSTTAGAANALSTPKTVSFPLGRFSTAPAVSAIANDSYITGVWATNITSTGFVIYLKSSIANRACIINWTAVVPG